MRVGVGLSVLLGIGSLVEGVDRDLPGGYQPWVLGEPYWMGALNHTRLTWLVNPSFDTVLALTVPRFLFYDIDPKFQNQSCQRLAKWCYDPPDPYGLFYGNFTSCLFSYATEGCLYPFWFRATQLSNACAWYLEPPGSEQALDPSGLEEYAGIRSKMWRFLKINLNMYDPRYMPAPEPLLHSVGLMGTLFMRYRSKFAEWWGDPYYTYEQAESGAVNDLDIEEWAYCCARPKVTHTCSNNMRAGFVDVDFNYTCDNPDMNGFSEEEKADLLSQMKPFTLDEILLPPSGLASANIPHPALDPPVYYWQKDRSMAHFNEGFFRDLQNRYQRDDDRYYTNKTFMFYSEIPEGYTYPDDKDKIDFCGWGGGNRQPLRNFPIVEATSWIRGMPRKYSERKFDVWTYMATQPEVYPVRGDLAAQRFDKIPDGPWNDMDCNDPKWNWPDDTRTCYKVFQDTPHGDWYPGKETATG